MLKTVLKEFNLVDAWRMHHPLVKDYTFYSHCHNVHTRIDFFLISEQHSTLMELTSIGPKLLSDHSWLEGRLCMQQMEDRQFSWSLNKSLLLSEITCNDLLGEMKFFFETNEGSVSSEAVLWDAFKAYMRGCHFLSYIYP